jgi:hypothetical protein
VPGEFTIPPLHGVSRGTAAGLGWLTAQCRALSSAVRRLRPLGAGRLASRTTSLIRAAFAVLRPQAPGGGSKTFLELAAKCLRANFYGRELGFGGTLAMGGAA